MESPKRSVIRENKLAVFEHVVQEKKNSKKKKSPSHRDSDESSPSDSELIIDDEIEGRKNKRVRLEDERLRLICEWNGCNAIAESLLTFNQHLIDHIGEGPSDLRCYWGNCKIECDSILLLQQHLSYHGYVTKAVRIGQNVLERNDLPACKQKPQYNIVISPGGLTCQWLNCTVYVYNFFDFYDHVAAHVKSYPPIAKGEVEIICNWNGCYSKFYQRNKLDEHVRSHTKQKIIGCPTCFVLFSNKTKFCDHRRRQLPPELQRYQCSQCLKMFPTERLLSDHLRCHISHYKCTMCNMTSTKPSILASHMRFKHIKDKPFECTECDKRFVTKYNLMVHLKTHGEDSFKCDSCDFTCRTKVGLQTHCIRRHDQQPPVYECHCCQKHFTRGDTLTKHLMRAHNYHWPSGHSKFRYKKDQDGKYRLQTVRYETLEVTEQMIKSETMQSKDGDTSKQQNEYPEKYVLSIAKDNADPETGSDEQNAVLITINDVDEHGNIIKSEVMESKEIIGVVSTDKLMLSEPDLPPDEPEEEMKIVYNDLTEIPTALSISVTEKVKKKDPLEKNPSKQNRRSKVVLEKYLKTGTDQLQTEKEEFTKTKISNEKRNKKRRKRKSLITKKTFKFPEIKNKIVKINLNSAEQRRRRSQRLRRALNRSEEND